MLAATCLPSASKIQTKPTVDMSDQNDLYDIGIQVQTRFIPEQSDLARKHHVFAYTITMKNQGQQPARLQTRHWIITDANGRVQEVHGEGVVGEHPYLVPGESYRYTSGTVLETPVGSMHGRYRWTADDGTEFEAPIPAFTLAIPGALH